MKNRRSICIKRKNVIIMMIICILISSTIVSFAGVDTELIQKETQTVSEYEYIVNLQSKSDDELARLGLDEAEINELRQIKLDQYLSELKRSSVNELRERGLSYSDIALIKSNEKDAIILSQTMGKVTYTVTAVKLTYSSGNSYLQTKFTWEWSSKPIQNLLDIVAVTTNKDFYRVSGDSYNKTTIKYYKQGDKSTTAKTRTESQYTENAGEVTYSKIPMVVAYPSPTSEKDDLYYAMKGTMYVKLKDSGQINTVNVAGNYGHTIVTCTPSVSVGANSLAIDFTPSLLINKGNEDTDSIDL